MTEFKIQQATIADIVELRTKILRPGQWPLPENYPQDRLSSTHHFSATHLADTIGIATFMINPLPERHKSDHVLANIEHTASLQLRGMGVSETFRKKGVGAALIKFAIQFFSEEVYDPETTLIWFNARETAIPFYQNLGFKTSGEFFEVPKIGPHKIMWSMSGDAS